MPDDSRHRLWRVWAVSFVLFAVAGFLWSISTPVGTGSDEAQHIIKAAATVRGEWTGDTVTGQLPAERRVTVPGTYRSLESQKGCYGGASAPPERCHGLPRASSRPVSALTYVGRYPPLYYLLVGSPTLVSQGVPSIYEMRWLTVLVASALLAMAVGVATVFGAGSLAVLGVVVAITPFVLYEMSTVQPSALEVSSGVLLWSCLVLLARAPDGPPPRALVHGAGVSASLLMLTRAVSPVLVVGIGLVVGAVLLPPGRVRELAGAKLVRRWIAVLVAVGAVACAWVLRFHAWYVMPFFRGLHRSAGLGAVLAKEASRTWLYLTEIVESFYPNDGQGHVVAYAVWFLLVLVTLAGAMVATRRERVAIVLLTLVELGTPFVVGAISFHSDGIVWQGRYSFPLTVGAPLIAAAALGRRMGPVAEEKPDGSRRAPWPRYRVLVGSVVTLGAFAQVLSLYGVLRRFLAGPSGSFNLFDLAHPHWSPPAPVALIVAGAAAVCVLTAAWYWHLCSVAGRASVAGAGRPAAAGQNRA